jgi:DNA-binding SARP family transcriptional activator
MIRLRVLGGFGLAFDCTGTPPGPGLRPRVLAVLALLAGHRSEGISRDKLLGYLWPDSDCVHARNSLKQALFSLRRSFDGRLLISDAGFLRLDPSAADVDLWDFESALLTGEEVLAVGMYRGPFLDGFYIDGLGEFERWVETQRQWLAHEYARVLATLAIRADRCDDRHVAITWWRRLAAAEPLSALPALGLMRALEAAGDPTGALDHGRKHAALVEAELGAPVSDEIRVLMRQLAFQGRTPRPVRGPWLQPRRNRPAPDGSRAPSVEPASAS